MSINATTKWFLCKWNDQILIRSLYAVTNVLSDLAGWFVSVFLLEADYIKFYFPVSCFSHSVISVINLHVIQLSCAYKFHSLFPS